jgi:rhodanese-related sulfurtransferase/DNA-binding transcriptional ArsR family regulator
MIAGKSPKRRINEQVGRIAKAVSSASRLELLELLAQGERTVEVLAESAGLTIANTSQHLQSLRRVGLVTARKQGLYVHYRLSDLEVVRLLSVMRGLAEQHLDEVDEIVTDFFSSRDALEAVPREELLTRSRSGTVTVLDVRPAEEFRAGHIPGALSVPLDQLERALRKLPADNEIVAYCRGPYCLLAFEAVETLRRRGRKARRLDGGLPEWRAAGLPVSAEEAA